MRSDQDKTISALFPLLCVVITVFFLSSMPIYRGIESSFSAEHGLGAAMSVLRETLEENESVSVFLGLQQEEAAVSVAALPQSEAYVFDLEAAVAAYIEANTPAFIMPLAGTLSSPHGLRVDPFYSGELLFLGGAPTEYHNGIDICPTDSWDIVAAADGVVRIAGYDASYGNYLVLTHTNCETLYAHCAAIHVSAGDAVRVGEKIADVGATGRATGIHLHFEVLCDGESVDPIAYFAQTEGGVPT